MATFALPAHYRTWQFQVNVVIPAQATVTLSNARFVRFAKDAMLGTGAWTDAAGAATASSGNWQVVSCSDGVGGFGNNDGVDRWLADANLVWQNPGTNHSWIVLSQAGIGGGPHYLYIDLSTSVNSYTLQYGWSKTLYTNGTATACPDGPAVARTNAYPLAGSQSWGGPTANAQNVLHVMKSADGKATRIICARNGWASGLWYFDELEFAPPGITSPAIAGIYGSSTTAPVASHLVQGQYANGGNFLPVTQVNQNPAFAVLYLLYYGINSLVTVPAVANDMSPNTWPMFRVGAYVRAGQTFQAAASGPIINARGNLGVLRDIWWMQSALGEGDGIPAGGGRNFTVLGDLCFPWNTTAITLT